MTIKPTTLPDNIDELKQLALSLSEENASLNKKHHHLVETLLLVRQKKFAASSEKYHGQGELFDEAESTLVEADTSLEDTQEEIVYELPED